MYLHRTLLYNGVQSVVPLIMIYECSAMLFITATAYEIQESESDDENKISEEHVDAWIEDDIDFLDNFHHF